MSKAEYSNEIEAIKNCLRREEYKEAISIANNINFHKLKSIYDMNIVASAYEKNNIFDTALDILLFADSKQSLSYRSLYKIADLAIMNGNVKLAKEYYNKYIDCGIKENKKYLLRYKLYNLENRSLNERIEVLKIYNKLELNDYYMLELAKLYYENGEYDNAKQIIDEINLFFRNTKVSKQANSLLKVTDKKVDKIKSEEIKKDDKSDTNVIINTNLKNIKQEEKIVETININDINFNNGVNNLEQNLNNEQKEHLDAFIKQMRQENNTEVPITENAEIKKEEVLEKENVKQEELNYQLVDDNYVADNKKTNEEVNEENIGEEQKIDEIIKEIENNKQIENNKHIVKDKELENNIGKKNEIEIKKKIFFIISDNEQLLEKASLKKCEDIIKDNIYENKIMKITASSLCDKHLNDLSNKINNRCLIVTKADEIKKEELLSIFDSIKKIHSSIIFNMKNKNIVDINKLIQGIQDYVSVNIIEKNNENTNDNINMDNKLLSVEEYKQYVEQFINQINCELDGRDALLALYERIEIMAHNGENLNVDHAEEFINKVADIAEKQTFTNFFLTLIGRDNRFKGNKLLLKKEHFLR